MKLIYILIALRLAGCSTNGAPILNFENQQIKRFDNRLLANDEMLVAVRKAANTKGWRVTPGYAPNHLIATLNVRNSHKAVVDILFKADTYSITYRDSEYLIYESFPEDRGQVRIHPNYNKWVSELNDEVFNRLQD